MLTLFFTFLFATITAHAQLQTQQIPLPGEFEIRGEFDYLNTSANFPSGGGHSTSLYGGGNYTKMQGVFQGTFDFTDKIRVYGGFSAAQVNANVVTSAVTSPSIVTNTHSNSGFNEVWAGAQYWYQLGDFDLVPQADIVYPAWRVDQTSNDPLLGDGALRVQGGGWVRYNLEQFIPYGYLGYAYRDEGRSALLPYAVGLLYMQPKSYWLEAELRGYQNASSDSNTSNRGVRELYLTRVDGGSFQYYAINPSVAEIAIAGGFQFNNLGVYAGASTTAFGTSMADSWTVLAGVTFNGSVIQQAPRRENNFRAKPEKYDERLFHETPTPGRKAPPVMDPDAAPVTVQRRAPPPPKPVRRRLRPAPTSDEPSVELMMKQTEKQLDNKK